MTEAPTYEEAFYRSDHGPFYYEVKASALDPTNYFMFNFRAINHIGWRCEQLANTAPSFHNQPQGQTVTRGQDVTLTATVTNSCLGHWRFNGSFVGQGDIFYVQPPVPFFYTNYLRITNVQPSHSGSYQFIAENRVDSVTSDVAVITLSAQLTSARYDNGAFAFQVSEDTGRAVIVETAPDLNPGTTWTPVFTNTAPFSFTNSTPADRLRFYRTMFR